MLSQLRAKRAGIPTLPFKSADSSPESVLVPSSSPVKVPATSKFFNGSMAQPTASGSLPSSNLARGTPNSVMSAIKSRHEPESPDSPPLSRLKSKYTESPSLKRSPSLVMAAKQQVLSTRETKARKYIAQYPSLDLDTVKGLMDRCDPGEDGKLHRMLKAEAERAKAIPPSIYPRPVKSNPTPVPIHSPVTPSSSATIAPSSFDGTPKQSKPRKNESSKIYANRTNRRKDPDEEETEVETDNESEGSWSDEGPRKKRRKDDEVDAEGAALNAFNEVTADNLTGTIGESQENPLIQRVPMPKPLSSSRIDHMPMPTTSDINSPRPEVSR